MDFIPKVKAPINKVTKEVEPNFVYSDDEIIIDEVESEVESDVDDQLSDEEIFIDEKPEPVKPVKPDKPVKPEKPEKPKKINKNGKERKPMSEEHKFKLQAAREKAMLVKKEKAKERVIQKKQDLEERKLLKLKRQKDKLKEIEALKKEVYDEPEPAPEPVVAAVSQAVVAPVVEQIREIIREPSITPADIERAQLNAILAHEKLRLARKDEKRRKQSEEQEYALLRQKLLKAQNPRNNFSGSRGFF